MSTDGKKSKNRWTCDVCQKPIAPGDGTIVISDPGFSGIPRHPSVRYHDEDGPKTVSVSEAAGASLAQLAAAARVVVAHFDCDKTDGYVIEVSRAESHRDWLCWLIHLSGKPWLDRRDLRKIARVYFTNRGETDVLP